MKKTKIPWCDYTINPVKGLCPMACPYCYARRMYKRFKWNPEIRYDADWWRSMIILRHESRIFVGSTFELFGEWVKPEWLEKIFYYVDKAPWHTFIFLTKQSQNLIKWSPFPKNCWVGVSATNYTQASKARYYLRHLEANIKFLSVEPLLSPLHDHLYCSLNLKDEGIQWLILGSQTQPVKHPPREWVDEIITAAGKSRIPVFVKEPMASHFNIHRQEFPDEE